MTRLSTFQTSRSINAANTRKINKRKRPAEITVADMLKDDGVPLHVRHWLERFVELKDKALVRSFVEQDFNTLEQAHLIYDVLESEGLEHGERKFPEEARDYIEEYIYRLAQASKFNLWNLGSAAVAALPVLLECSSGSLTDGDSNFIALDSAIRRLTTVDERREFLSGDRYKAETVDERNVEAGYKLSRVLADPQTSEETRESLEEALTRLSVSSQVTVIHPALAARAFLLMCEAKPGKGRAKGRAKDRRRLLSLLDAIENK